MKLREEDLERRIKEFMERRTQEIKKEILNKAKVNLRKVENKKIMEERRLALEERDRKTRIAEGLPPKEENYDGPITRSGFGISKPEERPSYRKGDSDKKSDFRNSSGSGPIKFTSSSGGFGRSNFSSAKPDEKKEEIKSGASEPPKYTSKPLSFSNTKKFEGKSDWRNKDAFKPTDEEKNETKTVKKSIQPKKKKTKEKDAGIGRFSSNW